MLCPCEPMFPDHLHPCLGLSPSLSPFNSDLYILFITFCSPFFPHVQTTLAITDLPFLANYTCFHISLLYHIPFFILSDYLVTVTILKAFISSTSTFFINFTFTQCLHLSHTKQIAWISLTLS